MLVVEVVVGVVVVLVGEVVVVGGVVVMRYRDDYYTYCTFSPSPHMTPRTLPILL